MMALKEESIVYLYTLRGQVMLRPVLKDRTEREVAFLVTDKGREYELVFTSENPYQLEVTKKYADKFVECKGTFWRKANGEEMFFSRFYKRIRPVGQPRVFRVEAPEVL
jgi:hypothetical protein